MRREHWNNVWDPAIGVYAEAGYRALEGNAADFTAGLTVRLPSLVGIAIVIPVPGC